MPAPVKSRQLKRRFQLLQLFLLPRFYGCRRTEKYQGNQICSLFGKNFLQKTANYRDWYKFPVHICPPTSASLSVVIYGRSSGSRNCYSPYRISFGIIFWIICTLKINRYDNRRSITSNSLERDQEICRNSWWFITNGSGFLYTLKVWNIACSWKNPIPFAFLWLLNIFNII